MIQVYRNNLPAIEAIKDVYKIKPNTDEKVNGILIDTTNIIVPDKDLVVNDLIVVPSSFAAKIKNILLTVDDDRLIASIETFITNKVNNILSYNLGTGISIDNIIDDCEELLEYLSNLNVSVYSEFIRIIEANLNFKLELTEEVSNKILASEVVVNPVSGITNNYGKLLDVSPFMHVKGIRLRKTLSEFVNAFSNLAYEYTLYEDTDCVVFNLMFSEYQDNPLFRDLGFIDIYIGNEVTIPVYRIYKKTDGTNNFLLTKKKN